MSLLRAEIIAKIRKGIRAGVGATRLYNDLRSVGRVTRKTDFLADYRSVSGIEKKDGLLRFVRKDRYPTGKVLATVEWELSQEYMYKVRVQSTLKVGEPITERFVNIMSDVPLTPEMLENQVEESWGEWERYAKEEIVSLQVWSAVRRAV